MPLFEHKNKITTKTGNPFDGNDNFTSEESQEMWHDVKETYKDDTIDTIISLSKKIIEAGDEGNERINIESVLPYLYSQEDLDKYQNEVGFVNISGSKFSDGGLMEKIEKKFLKEPNEKPSIVITGKIVEPLESVSGKMTTKVTVNGYKYKTLNPFSAKKWRVLFYRKFNGTLYYEKFKTDAEAQKYLTEQSKHILEEIKKAEKLEASEIKYSEGGNIYLSKIDNEVEEYKKAAESKGAKKFIKIRNEILDYDNGSYLTEIKKFIPLKNGNMSWESVTTYKGHQIKFNKNGTDDFGVFKGDKILSVKNTSIQDAKDRIDSSKFKQGGGIKRPINNQYKGREPKDIWTNLTIRQREHFLHDHFKAMDTKELENLSILGYDDLPSNIETAFWNHVSVGQYKQGGKIKKPKNWIQGALSGHKGALRKTALKKGLLKDKNDTLSKTDLRKLEKMGGKTAKEARLAKTLMSFEDGGLLKTKFKYIDKNIEGRNATKLVRAAGEHEVDKYIKRLSDKEVIITIPSDKKDSEILLDVVEFCVGRNNLVPISEAHFNKGGNIEKGTPEWHQLRIAKKTIKMTPAMATVMGGMTVDEAKKILDKHNIKYKEGGTLSKTLKNKEKEIQNKISEAISDGKEFINKELGKFETGGKVATTFIKRVKNIHKDIDEVILKDGTHISGKDLMEEGGIIGGFKIDYFEGLSSTEVTKYYNDFDEADKAFDGHIKKNSYVGLYKKVEGTEDEWETVKQNVGIAESKEDKEDSVLKNIFNGQIALDTLKKIIGYEPKYPYETVGTLKLEKCYYVDYYRVVV